MITSKKAVLPSGFVANGVYCGIKRSGKLDLALIHSLRPAKAACKFTTNAILAAPIKINKQYLSRNKSFSSIIINSGNANCFTGKIGLKDAQAMSEQTAEYLGVKKESVLVCSTGIIGRKLPLDKIKKAMPGLVNGLTALAINKAKKAILTTDTFTKEITASFKIGKKKITICGIAKGAGMIAPDMATLLCFILTDALVTQKALDKALEIAIEDSFNCITVDGCMSTNDTVIFLANGESKNSTIDINKNFIPFLSCLRAVCLVLAKLVVKDAEGSSKFIKISVENASNYDSAKKVALAIANSNLFKTAIYGQNPNFGRVVASVGASGVKINEEDLKIKLGPLNKKEVEVVVNLSKGKAACTVYTSDLTPEYIKINASYS